MSTAEAPLQTSDFDYPLPPELIAQHPAARRDASRLLILERSEGKVSHHRFPGLLDHLDAGDVLVLNNSRVIPARLRGINAATGGHFEILLVEENAANDWWVMLRPGKRARRGTRIHLLNPAGEFSGIEAAVRDINAEGHRRLEFMGSENIREALDALGETPLPPYITRPSPNVSREDRERYQTVYARPPGSVAAPTAGLHFTPGLLHAIETRGVRPAWMTLHVGLGTFAPVKVTNVEDHAMHEERYDVPPDTARVVNQARRDGGRIIAVGTTTVRVLETVAAANQGRLVSGSGRTRIFIRPPHPFRIVDALLTNFHLPCSTLLMLVSAFAAPGERRGRELILKAYSEAIAHRYRFFSYGDAMLIL